MAFVTIDEFENKFEIHTQGIDTNKLSAYIQRYEDSYLRRMLGVELYDLFIQGVADDDPVYTALRDEFVYQSDCGKIVESRGVVDMLLGFIYFEYVRDKRTQATTNAAVTVKGQNSTPSGVLESNIFGRFNESIDTYKAIQQKCMDESEVYPEFKGIDEGYSFLTY